MARHSSSMQQRNGRSMLSLGAWMALWTMVHTVVAAPHRTTHRRSAWHLRGGAVPPEVHPRQGMPQNLAVPYPESNGIADSSRYQHPSSTVSNTDAVYAPPQQYPPSSNHPPPNGAAAVVDPIHETVQDRLDAWKEKQLQSMDHYQRVPVDDKGRAKLLLSITKSSRVIVFFVFTWRTLHLYEQVVGTDRTSGTSALFANPFGPKALLALPVFLLFLADVLGTILSLTSISSFTKKRLKAILNLNKCAELLVFFHSMVRLTVWPSRYTTPEIYVGRALHAFLLLVQVQALTRSSWDETAAPSVQTYREMSRTGATQPSQEASPPHPYGAPGYNNAS